MIIYFDLKNKLNYILYMLIKLKKFDNKFYIYNYIKQNNI